MTHILFLFLKMMRIFILLLFLINIFSMFLQKERKIYFCFLKIYYIFSEKINELRLLFVKLILMYNITRNSFSTEKKLKVINATRLCYCFYLNIFLFSTLNYHTILKKKALLDVDVDALFRN